MFQIQNNKYASAALFVAVLIFSSFVTVYAATTISTNIQTDGTLSVTGTTTTQSVVFGNGWTVASTTSGSSSLTVSDAANNAVLIFDTN